MAETRSSARTQKSEEINENLEINNPENFLIERIGDLFLVENGASVVYIDTREDVLPKETIGELFARERLQLRKITDLESKEQSEEMLEIFIEIIRDKKSSDVSTLTLATDFMCVMTKNNYHFAEKLTHLLMNKHFLSHGGQRVDELTLEKDYRDHAFGRERGLQKARIREILARRHNRAANSMKGRIKKGEQLTRSRNTRALAEFHDLARLVYPELHICDEEAK